MKKKIFILILAVIIFIFSGCVININKKQLDLNGYWKYSVPGAYEYSDGFIIIDQKDDVCTFISSIGNYGLRQSEYKILENGLEIEQEDYLEGVQLLSGEILPDGTYTVLEQKLGIIDNFKIDIFQNLVYVIDEEELKLLKKDSNRKTHLKGFEPENIDKYLSNYEASFHCTKDYENIFKSGEEYKIYFDLNAYEELPSCSLDGTVTFANGDQNQSFNINFMEWYSLIVYNDYYKHKYISSSIDLNGENFIFTCMTETIFDPLYGMGFIGIENHGLVKFTEIH